MPLQLNIRLSEALACCLVVLFVFAAHFAYGAGNWIGGVTLAALEGAVLLAMLALPWARRALETPAPALAPAAAFALVVAVALWTLTP